MAADAARPRPRRPGGIPALAYPTYDVGVRIAGGDTVLIVDGTAAERPAPRRGDALAELARRTRTAGCSTRGTAEVVELGPGTGTIVVSDECYLEFGWDADADRALSVLHPDVCGDSHTGPAGHPLAVETFEPCRLPGRLRRRRRRRWSPELLEIRKHAGMIVPRAGAGRDDRGARRRRPRRGAEGALPARRTVLREALERAGFRIDHSEAGLYLWATRDEPCWETVNRLAESGILAAPGDFYGEAGVRHVRIALTATDERVAAAAGRLAATA